jgi:hypothetical protein
LQQQASAFDDNDDDNDTCTSLISDKTCKHKDAHDYKEDHDFKEHDKKTPFILPFP